MQNQKNKPLNLEEEPENQTFSLRGEKKLDNTERQSYLHHPLFQLSKKLVKG